MHYLIIITTSHADILLKYMNRKIKIFNCNANLYIYMLIKYILEQNILAKPAQSK
jgi:hypothetical protein